MAAFEFDYGKNALAAATLTTWQGSARIRVRLLKTGSTASSSRDAQFLSNITTVPAHDGTTDQTVTGCAIIVDTTNHVVRLDAGDTTFAAVPAAAGGAVPIAALYYWEPASSPAESNRVPLFYHDGGFTGAAANGSDITIRPHSNGLYYF